MSMLAPDFVPISEAHLEPKSRSRFVECLERRGEKVARICGTYWRKTNPLFFDSLHWLARMPVSSVKKPHPLCLGFRTTVALDEADQVKGRMPIHLLGGEDLAKYDEATLPSKRRNQLRKARKLVQFIQVIRPEAHLERLHEIVASAVTRIGYTQPPDFERYRRGIVRRVREDRDALLAGLVDGRLAGYFLVSVVEDVAYIEQVMLDTEYLSTDIGTGLTFETVRVIQRARQIQFVVYGLHSIENPSLTRFKEGMGFKVVEWPVKYWLSPLLKWYLSWRAPEKLYRIAAPGS